MKLSIATRILLAATAAILPLLPAERGSCDVGATSGGLWPPQGALHRGDLPRMGPEVGLRADCNGVPVYGFGYSYIYGLSPDLASGARIQVDNNAPTRKIVPKKSWEIRSNQIGATPPRMPRTARSDFQPFVGIHLIDGDSETYWACRGQNQPDVEPAWARIDLAKETPVDTIVIVPREDNHGMPGHLVVKVSQDGCHWETVYDNPNQEVPENAQPVNISFTRRPVKQIWVVGRNLRPLRDWGLHVFCVAEVKVLDEKGENAALVSRGAGVTVSSFESFISSQRETHRTLWPVHYDLGVKWIRVNYAGSVLNWRMVEREKGVYEIDPEADAAITESVKNGCRIIFGLGFTNWLYASQGHPDRKVEKQLFHTNELSVPLPPPTPEMLEGFKKFVQFMVKEYKDRADYFEIWNEQSGGYGGWGNAPPELFTQWVKEVSPIIKKIHPKAKVVMGSLSGLGPRREVGLDWLKACFEAGIAPYIDAIGWHGYYGAAPEDKEWLDYVKDVRETKALAESHGFKGEYLHSEWCIFAPYPRDITKLQWITEMVKAKHMARFAIANLGLDVMFFWNETWCDGHIDRDVGLFRNAFSASPMSESQPQPAYYVLRTLCTIFEDAQPAPMLVQFSNKERKLESWTFELPKGDRLVSVSLAGNSADDSPDYQTDITIPGETFGKAVAIDVLNGTEQDLIVSRNGTDAVLRGMLVKDYPIVLRLSKP
ncbi:MAG: discoidin domain-containing protein [Armatimonadetes bacterium]|nr:discoidin domain-containing protein [Armatimonadota bacterium]